MDSKEAKEDLIATWKTKITTAGGDAGLFCIGNGQVGTTTTENKPPYNVWVFHQIGKNLFNILNEGGASDGRSFLGVNESGTETYLFPKDDGSGRQRWTLHRVSPNLFTIKVAGGTGDRIYLSHVAKGRVLCYDHDDGEHQQWKLLVPMVNVSFTLDQGRILGSSPEAVAEQTLTNSSSTTQSMSFEVTEKIEESSTFEQEVGVTLTIGASFEVGLPFVGNGEISTELTTSFACKYGVAQTFSTEVTASFQLVAPPHKKVICQAIVTKSKLEVPYVFTFADGYTETGTWSGTSAWDLRESITKYDFMEEEHK